MSAAPLRPHIVLPFLVVTLIWGSTWIVIRDQLAAVPAPWSVSYRFILATGVMFVWAALRGSPLRLDARTHGIAMLFGLVQFMVNFNAVYQAEKYVTSGVVAIVFALLLVPNSLLARIFLGHIMTARFVAGSTIAAFGVGLLFVHELRTASVSPAAVATGIGFTLAGVLGASIGNVMQASQRVRAVPLLTILAWGMFYGTIANLFVAWVTSGPPTIELRIGYWAGLLYLGVVASAFAFNLYFGLVRAIGPGPAAYTSLLIPIFAMGFSTAFEDYRWSPLSVAGAVLALAGLFIALRARKAAIAAPAEG